MDLGLLFRNKMVFVPFELEKMEFGILIPGIPLPEKSQKECGLRNKSNVVLNAQQAMTKGHCKRQL